MKRITATIDILPLADSATPPTELLIPFGELAYTKGENRASVTVDGAFADAAIADFTKRGKELVIDFEHATLTGQPAPAAGWIDRLEKTAAGLVCHVKAWTDKAGAFLAAREYKYFSPVIYRPEGKPGLHSFALTNHPALHGLPALVAVDDQDTNETQENRTMNEHLQSIAVALGLAPLALSDGKPDESATAAAILAKIGENATTAKALADKLALHDAAELVGKAFADGKLIEAQREWAMKFAANNPQAFADFAANQPKVCPGPAAAAAVKQDKAEPLALTDDERMILKNSGIDPEQYLTELKKKGA
jgi:phage I-like protein